MYGNYTRCLPEERLGLTITAVDRALLHYVFPVQFLLGVFGNSLILWVLCSESMKNRASDLLAAVSLADLAFLILMLPHSLATFEVLEKDLTFRFIYFYVKQNLGALANWMSASAIWLILVVSIERFLVIKSPLRSRMYWKTKIKCLILLSIFCGTGVLTLYHHFAYDCKMMYMCSGTQLSHVCYSAAKTNHPVSLMDKRIVHTPPIKRYYIRVSTVGNAILVVFIPIMLVVVLNILLLRQLKTSSERNLLEGEGSKTHGIFSNHMRQKRRVTMTVVAIALCFSITQGPSAIMVLWELFGGYAEQRAHFYTIFSITNCLVVSGKTINFILFCVSSVHFRRKCATLFFQKFPQLSQTSFAAQWGRQNSSTYRASISSSRRGSQYLETKAHKFVAELQPLAEISLASTDV